MPSIGLLGETKNGVIRGMSPWSCAIIPGPGPTLSGAAGNQAEAAALCLGCQPEGTVPLRNHGTQVLFSKSGFCAHKSACLHRQRKEGAWIFTKIAPEEDFFGTGSFRRSLARNKIGHWGNYSRLSFFGRVIPVHLQV